MLKRSSMKTQETSKISIKSVRVLAEVINRLKSIFLTYPISLGAYGEVRKCLNKETKALRAVKIINKKFLEEEEKKKLLGEISILK
jgi:serine/threonine protein kinase